MEHAETNLTVGSPGKQILRFSIPVFLSCLLQQFYSLVDTVIVGQFLGKEALAGVGSTGSINFMIIGFCMGICFGFVIPVSQRFGARDYSGMRKFIANSYWMSVIFSIILTVIVCVFCKQILIGMRTPENIIQPAYDYIFLIFLGIPITIAYNLLAGIIRSLGDSKTPFIILLMASVVNIGFDILSVTVLHMGVRGPALATVLSQLFSAVLCLIFMKRKFAILKMEKGEWHFEGKYAMILCGMGIPMGLQYSITAIGSVILQMGINSLGSNAVAAVSAAGRIIAFTACPMDALGSTIATYTGQNVGAKKFDRIHQGLKAANKIGIIYSIVIFAVMLFGAKYTLLLFIKPHEVEVLTQAALYLKINIAFYILLTFVNTYRFTIQGAGYSGFAILAGILEMIARATVGVALVPLFGFTSVCFASPAAWICADIFLIPAFHYVMRRLQS